MKLKELRIDSEAKENGIWIDLPGFPGVRVKTRASDALPYRRFVQEQVRRLTRGMRRGDISLEESDRIDRQALARHSLIDWSGVEDDDGRPIPFSSEAAERFFADPDYCRFYDACRVAAFEAGDIKRADLEAAEGNSAPPSGGG